VSNPSSVPKPKTTQEILDSLPKDVSRIQVVDEFGKQRYRKIAEILPTDKIVMNGRGLPVTMSTDPGRPQKITGMDLPPVNESVAEVIRAKHNSMKSDELTHIVRTNPESSNVLDLVLTAIAEEAASLGFERQDLERRGQPTSQVSLRRIGALKAIGETWLRRKEQIANSGVDMDSPAFKRLFLYLTETFTASMNDAKLRPEMIQTIFSKLAARLDDDDWRREAIRRMTEGESVPSPASAAKSSATPDDDEDDAD
jgi:hypothetical protein